MTPEANSQVLHPTNQIHQKVDREKNCEENSVKKHTCPKTMCQETQKKQFYPWKTEPGNANRRKVDFPHCYHPTNIDPAKIGCWKTFFH